MSTVYIIHSTGLGRYYTGMTMHLQRRIKQHRAGATRSVPRSNDWQLVWHQTVNSTTEARILEKRIKGRGAARFVDDQR